MEYFISENNLYLSFKALALYGINKGTVQKWRMRNIGEWINIETRFFILYNSIPFRTRKKLPHADKIISAESKKMLIQK